MSWTIRSVLDWIREDLAKKGVDAPRVDAELLVADALGKKRIDLYLDLDRPLADEELSDVRARVKRRRAREPVAYILGERDFYGRTFEVGPGVLVPRPDTETLVARALEILAPGSAADAAPVAEPDQVAPDAVDGPRTVVPLDEDLPGGAVMEGPRTVVPIEEDVEQEAAEDLPLAPAEAGDGTGGEGAEWVADVCTGSGCIGLSLAAERPQLRVVATDVSPEALAIARRNAARLGVSDRVELLEGDLFAPLGERRFHQLLINPPYLAEAELERCEPEVAQHEPRLALVAGPRGDEVLERIARDAASHLEPGGVLLVEVGYRQAGAFAERLRAVPELEGVRTHRDLGGVERIVEAKRRSLG